MPLTHAEAERQISAFRDSRAEWIDTLVKNPDSTEAPHMISVINSKISLVRALAHYWD